MSEPAATQSGKAEPAAACRACGVLLDDDAAIAGKDRLLGTPGAFEVRVCTSCGSGNTFPSVDESGLAAYYPNDYIETETWTPHGLLGLISKMIRRRTRRRSIDAKPIGLLAGRTGNLLDVGCGRGELGSALIDRGWRVSGVEPSDSGAAQARAYGLDVQQGTLTTAKFRLESFDVVNFRHSLEHVADPAADLRRAVALLAPGGQLLVEVPNFACWERRHFGSVWFHLDLPRHRTHFTPGGMHALLEDSGLDQVQIGTRTSANGLAGSIQYRLFGRWLASGPLSARVIDGLSRLLVPVAVLARIVSRGGGDFMWAVAVKPAVSNVAESEPGSTVV